MEHIAGQVEDLHACFMEVMQSVEELVDSLIE